MCAFAFVANVARCGGASGKAAGVERIACRVCKLQLAPKVHAQQHNSLAGVVVVALCDFMNCKHCVYLIKCKYATAICLREGV